MTTSGVYRSLVDLLITCSGPYGCGWVGWIEATEDSEDMTLSWSCPSCLHEEEETLR